jgi:PAS domain S-box-containing protein
VHTDPNRTLGGGDAGPIRVLHVDDEPEFAEMAAEFLERADDRLAVEVATAGDDVLCRLSDGDVDCVVSDYDMPGRTGLDLLRTVRESHPDLPFILFTNEGSETLASEAIAAGVTDYLRKASSADRYAILANRIVNAVEADRSRRALRARRRRLETLISNLPGIVYRCLNEPGWPMAFVEGECRSLTGHPASALETGDVVWGEEVVHPDDREELWASVQDALSRGDSFEATYRIVTADGTTKWVWERGREVEVADDDRTALEGFITDVTHRTERERRLHRLRERTQELMYTESATETARVATEAADDIIGAPLSGVHLLTDDGDALEPHAAVAGFEEVFEEVPRYPRDEPPGSRAAFVWEVFESGDPEHVDDLNGDGRLTEETPARSVIVHPLGDHGVFIVSSEAAAAFDDTDEALVELLATSLRTAMDRVERETELRRQRNELRRRNERLDKFASVVSHDLRNPLSVASGRLELAREECDSDHLREVAHAHERIEALVDDLLTLAREGEGSSEPMRVDLANLSEDCWRNVATAGAELRVDAEGAVAADRKRLQQLLENLFRNSVEHGGGGVTVTVGDLDDGFYVADDGPGIPAEERDRVFEAGYSTAPDGTGFGLSIVERVAEDHGWEVGVADGRDGGARVEVRTESGSAESAQARDGSESA